jgi:hypothetical protein
MLCTLARDLQGKDGTENKGNSEGHGARSGGPVPELYEGGGEADPEAEARGQFVDIKPGTKET